MMYLYIDLLDIDPQVCLFQEKGCIASSFLNKNKSISQQLIKEIELLLKKDIKGILVSKGPGGFTTTRIGIAFANAFGYINNIPVIGFEKKHSHPEETIKEYRKQLSSIHHFTFVSPYYDKEPNITKPKV